MENENEKQLLEEIKALRIRLAEAEETSSAIRGGGVDAIVVSGLKGEQVFTLTGAERAYRVLIETMNQGAASLNREGLIIYSNHRLSEMLKTPLEKVIGVHMRQFIRASDLPLFDNLMGKGSQESGKGEVSLINGDGTVLPVLLSVSELQKDNADICGISVTDLSAQKHIEDELRRHRDHLEELVKDRTDELETANRQLRDEITERKRTELFLRTIKQRLRLFVEYSPAAIAMFDKDMKYVIASRRWYTDYHLNDKELIGRSHYEVFPEIPERWKEIHRRCLAGAVEKCDEDSFPRADGSVDWIRWEIHPWRNEAGEIGGIIVFSEVTTERKLAVEALRESESKFRKIINVSPVPCALNDRKENVIYLNAAFVKTFGYNLKDIPTLSDWWPRAYPDAEYRQRVALAWQANLDKAKQTGAVFEPMEVNIQCKDGTQRTVIVEYVSLGETFKDTHMVTFFDITERKYAENQLAVNEIRLRTLVQTIPDLIWLKNTDGVYLTCNKMFERFFGAKEADIVGKTDYDFVSRELADFFREHDRKAMEAGKPSSNTEWITFAGDGQRALLETIKTPMLDTDGKLIGVLGIGRDITESHRLADQLRHAQKMEAVGTLAGGVAHDFNNILNVILGYGAMVMDTLAVDSQSKKDMKEVLAAADRAADLTKRLLVFSRKQVVEVKPVDINELIFGMQKMLVRIIRESIDFHVDLMDRPLIVQADAGQIEQVLINLAANARDAMPEGGRLTISTGLVEVDEEYVAAYGYGKPGKYVLITVADTGQGMDAETQKKIFEPFFTTKGVGEGTGLGLAISYGIIKQHDGYIKVYSEPGHGTVFKIYLPLSEIEALRDKKTEDVVAVKGGNETILVAEDDATLRKMTEIILESFGYTVISAEDGEDAITKFMENRERIRLVVLDMIMPKKNGKEVSAEIRKVSPGMGILFVSGYTMEIITNEELTEGGFDFIQKPFQAKDLLAKVREVLDRWNN